jgi:pyoverdine/dityrosine biosynthesis protein Dit1
MNALKLKNPAEAILNLLLEKSNTVKDAPSLPPACLHPSHRIKLETFLRLGEKIQIVLPAFPAKSPNREKTLGARADFAEVLSLRQLNALCESIRSFHAPGAEVIVCSDGRVFSDLVLVNDRDVTLYQHSVQEIVAEFSLRNIRLFNLDEIFPQKSFEEMRSILVQEHAAPLEAIRASVRGCPAENFLFNGIHRFLFEDRLPLFPELSRSRVREECKDLAYRVIQRSHAWSSLVEKIFPQAIRLSIHPQLGGSPKLGYRLVQARENWRTPWHSVALKVGSAFTLVKRSEAESLGAELRAEGKYEFFELRQA